jgi:hypothetical protein
VAGKTALFCATSLHWTQHVDFLKKLADPVLSMSGYPSVEYFYFYVGVVEFINVFPKMREL